MALKLGGSSAYVRRDCTGDLIGATCNGPWTLAGWFRLDTDSDAAAFLAGLDNGAGSGFHILAGANGTVLSVSRNFDPIIASSYDLVEGTWVYIALRKKTTGNGENELRYALSGAGAMTSAVTETGSSNNAPTYLEVGYSASLSNYPFNGTVAHLRLWNSEVSNNDLLIEMDYTSHAAAASAGSGAGDPWLAWEFEGNADDQIGTRDGSVSGAGYSWVSGPISSGVTISDAGDEMFTAGETGITISGTGFGATKGTGKVVLSPTDDVDDAGAVEQTTTAWADTSITMTAVKGSLSYLTTLYMFVVNDAGTSNASGYQVQLEPKVYVRETLVDLNSNPVANASGLSAFIWRTLPASNNSTPAEVLTSKSTDAQGDTDWQIARGALTVNAPIWIMIFKDGTPFKATARKITPVYE